MVAIYLSRPSSRDWEGDITLQSQENMERLWHTIQSVRLGIITPSSAAMACFTWFTDIVNGRCPPFYPEAEAEAAVQPGDTPGMQEFHDRLCGYLGMNSGLSDEEQQDLLLEFMVGYWRLLQTKKRICRGETMELPTLGMDNTKHMGFSWVNRAVYNHIAVPFDEGLSSPPIKEDFETTAIVLEIIRRELYTRRISFRGGGRTMKIRILD
ncbi:hypothetical protein DFP73DRAFT_583825 [Morchella snyderi]|nr:hypothetical protein DFP73DRAFT_583825 [Morchella snyderi]